MPSAASAWAGARSCRPMCAFKRKAVIDFFELHDVRDDKFMARGTLAFAAVTRTDAGWSMRLVVLADAGMHAPVDVEMTGGSMMALLLQPQAREYIPVKVECRLLCACCPKPPARSKVSRHWTARWKPN